MTNVIHRPRTPASVVLTEAVNAVIKSFAKHSANGTVIASDALQEFWDMKSTKNNNLNSISPILYESEIERSKDISGFVCYVTLPGGSCFGSYSRSQNEEAAKQSAAKVALMNSVFNEHPSRLINKELIEKILSSVASGRSAQVMPLGAFRSMMVANMGKSLLKFQEMMTIFQLLHWNGNLKEMKRRQCTREEVILRYSGCTVDHRMRTAMVQDWSARERENPGTVQRELRVAMEGMRQCREVGQDLRFHKEKRDLLRKVLSEVYGTLRKSSEKLGRVFALSSDEEEDDSIQVVI